MLVISAETADRIAMSITNLYSALLKEGFSNDSARELTAAYLSGRDN